MANTKKYTILDFAYDILKESTKPLTFQEIWEQGKSTVYINKLSLSGKTPWNTLGARLFVEVRDKPEDTRFIKVGKNPARFFLREKESLLSDDIIRKIDKEEQKSKKETHSYNERDLHPLLAYFAYTNTDFNKGKAIYTKTIYHEKSKKNGLNEWIHPDMVGFYIPIEEWNSTLLEFNKVSESNSIKLYSFELKKNIDKSNYRAYFFQAVSNSSWANESYLVTAGLKQDDDLLSELERLCSAFGIGLIKLDIEDIDSSKVLFQARIKESTDWEMMNKLCEQNRDFESFIDDITKDYTVKTIHNSQYDKILEEPQEYIEQRILGK